MTPANRFYDSWRMAAAYAFARPPVHQHIVKTIGERLRITTRLPRALDIGCGAGLSTAALEPIAESVIGLEPFQRMLEHAHQVAPRAHFLVGHAERLPFSASTFDLLTAAGSLDYVDLGLFLPEAHRVLATDGGLVVYDFSISRRAAPNGLGDWYGEFERRYPAPSRPRLDVTAIAYADAHLQLESYEALHITVPMTFSSYVSFVCSESRVELALARGVPEADVRGWCERSLRDLFGEESLDVWFEAYVAFVTQERSR
jgi:SAM-dependent methyltransferase